MNPSEAVIEKLNVSRETLERLNIYVAEAKKWNPRINLVAKSTIDQIWDRHILDSAQILDLAPVGTSWADLGSGGGFPGLVIAAIVKEKRPDLRVTLVESDKRKTAFLMTCARNMGVEVQIISERIENIPPLKADIISARALASLDILLGFAEQHMKESGSALFLKGANVDKEIKEALANWRFAIEKSTSKTDKNAVILKIGEIQRV